VAIETQLIVLLAGLAALLAAERLRGTSVTRAMHKRRPATPNSPQ
jgi:hypothetical protein